MRLNWLTEKYIWSNNFRGLRAISRLCSGPWIVSSVIGTKPSPCMLATKMKLKGKTLRWRRLYSHSYLLKLGVSHPTRAAIRYGVFGRIISKQKLALWGFSQILISQTAKNLSKLKPLNIYHGRGVRTTRAVIFRKAGKVSSYR